MSSHSRSSSEIESFAFGDILSVYIKEFCRDFDFNDVKHNVAELFTREESDYISEARGDAQIFHLFWVLQTKKDSTVLDFLNIISFDHKWLADWVKSERNGDLRDTTELYLEELKSIRSRHQDHTDYNVHRTQYFMELRRALCRLKPYESVVLLGDLGNGKKWLAIDVCSEFGVMKAMNFKIYWIDARLCTSAEEDLNALEKLLIKLHRHPSYPENLNSISNRILFLQQELKLILQSKEYRNCLLVLTNVQNVKTLKAFDLGCKRLIITRNKKVSESLSSKLNKHLSIHHGLTLNEFNLLLDKYIKYNRKEFSTYAIDIHDLSNGHPYLLSIIAQNLRQKKSNWPAWKQNLQNLHITDNKFVPVIEASLKVLSPELLQLYATFSIFPQYIGIPVKLLAALWDKSLHEAEEVVRKLYTYSFVNKEMLNDDDTMICTLPFVYSSHLKSSMKNKLNETELHRKVIEYYRVEESLNGRSEVELFDEHHDLYFFKCIGYHLKGANYLDMFAKLYLDFGFLAQKMRSVGLLHTIGDLKDYKEEIIRNDCVRLGQLLCDICDFLPKVEEKIVHSKDTCLLQYALMSSGPVNELAQQQIRNFPRRVWFSEKGNFHQRRLIVNLPNAAKIVNLLEQDICVIVLENNNMLLVDISLDCSSDPVYLINDNMALVQIVEMRLFSKDNYILTLDERGQLKLWSIEDERRRSVIQRRNSKQKANTLNFRHSGSHLQAKPCKQRIDEMPLCRRSRIVAFHIEQLPRLNEEIYLHVAFHNGDVCVLVWNKQCAEFQRSHVPVLPTRLVDIRYICKILSKYYMLLNTASNISFWNLRDGSKVPVSFEWPVHKTSLIAYQVYTSANDNNFVYILFVFADKILRLAFKQQRLSILEGSLQVLLDGTDYHITCAKLSLDGRYLVVGSKTGLVVFDTATQSEMLRGIVSENIRCVDVFDLEDAIFKYMITCGVKQKEILYLFCLRKTGENTVGWLHSSLAPTSTIVSQTEEEPQLEPNVRLLGGKLFDITYNRKNALLFAADSKNRIHQICTKDTKNWSIVMPTESCHRISAITAFKQRAFVGYMNGDVFNLHTETVEAHFTEEPISYLQLLDENILVASAKATPVTLVRHLHDETKAKKYAFDTKHCFKILDKYLLLVNEYGVVVVLDVALEFTNICILELQSPLGGCDCKNSHLFLATSSYDIHVYKLFEVDSSFQYKKLPVFSRKETEFKVTCLVAAHDASLVAVALEIAEPAAAKQIRGDIEVYKISDNHSMTFLYCLKSHVAPVYDMKFSPDNDVLVSVSEQLCFWSVIHMLNNPLSTKSTKRRSSRFSSQRSSDLEEVDANVLSRQCKVFLQVIGSPCKTPPATLQKVDSTDASAEAVLSKTDVWRNCCGPSDKPELLACIKLDGNKAEMIFANEDFTQFNTIDDEGVYYNLVLLTPQPDSCNDYNSTDDTDDNTFVIHDFRYRPPLQSNHSGEDVIDDVII